MLFPYKLMLAVLLSFITALLTLIGFKGSFNFTFNSMEKLVPSKIAVMNKTSKNILQRNRNTDRLVFNRIPKCGTKGLRLLFSNLSVTNGFHHMTINHDPYWIFNSTELDTIASMVLNLQSPAIYTRHMHFIDFSLYSIKQSPYLTYINIVRDPVERLVSWFYFQREHPRKKFSSRFSQFKETFDECVQNNSSECTDPEKISALIPFFCGHEDFCQKSSEKAFLKAKENLRLYSVVGYLENMDKFLHLLEYLWPGFFSGAQEVYKAMYVSSDEMRHKTINKVDPSQKTRDIMKKRLFWEYKFYELVKENFDKLYYSFLSEK